MAFDVASLGTLLRYLQPNPVVIDKLLNKHVARLQEVFGYDVLPFGSMTTGFCLRTVSDIDCTVLVLSNVANDFRSSGPGSNPFGARKNGYKKKQKSKAEVVSLLQMIESLLQSSPGEFSEVRVIKAQVPIVKCKILPSLKSNNPGSHQGPFASELSCDISLNNTFGVRNSRLLRAYASCPLFRDLGFLVKYWAHRNWLVGTYQGGLSSYSCLLLTVFFLQQYLPVLPRLFHEGPILQQKNHYCRDRNEATLRPGRGHDGLDVGDETWSFAAAHRRLRDEVAKNQVVTNSAQNTVGVSSSVRDLEEIQEKHALMKFRLWLYNVIATSGSSSLRFRHPEKNSADLYPRLLWSSFASFFVFYSECFCLRRSVVATTVAPLILDRGVVEPKVLKEKIHLLLRTTKKAFFAGGKKLRGTVCIQDPVDIVTFKGCGKAHVHEVENAIAAAKDILQTSSQKKHGPDEDAHYPLYRYLRRSRDGDVAFPHFEIGVHLENEAILGEEESCVSAESNNTDTDIPEAPEKSQQDKSKNRAGNFQPEDLDEDEALRMALEASKQLLKFKERRDNLDEDKALRLALEASKQEIKKEGHHDGELAQALPASLRHWSDDLKKLYLSGMHVSNSPGPATNREAQAAAQGIHGTTLLEQSIAKILAPVPCSKKVMQKLFWISWSESSKESPIAEME